MSKERVYLFKTLKNSHIKSMELVVEKTELSYEDNQVDRLITFPDEEVINSNEFYLGKANEFWDPNHDNLLIRRVYSINNSQVLFGDKGIISKESTLGIGAHIYSRSSNFQTTISIDKEIFPTDNVTEFVCQINFPAAKLTGEINIDLFFYLKSINEVIPMFAVIPGTRLGIFDSFKIIMDGDGSIFPIVEVEKENAPLWNVVIKWTDILTDLFDTENVRIEINNKHKMYNNLYNQNRPSTYLLVEILSNAISQIIYQAIQEEQFIENTYNDENALPDSIYSVINYWISTFEVNINSLDSINYSLRKNLESLFME